ncbi:hypothetical protein WN944_024461 [Citrus x changshan-huyou]|uniref:HAT C-terminal dimerisation domain-containing protein n=1 Tax=Citrus x changshan-huyou TaxID=2935761 RepID=A0AAP0QC34_9ROSI
MEEILRWAILLENNKGKYPILAEVARDFLAIHVSTVASKSTFSTGGRHFSTHRNRLHENTVKALMCTQNWYWTEIRDHEPLKRFVEQIMNAEGVEDPDD